MGPGIIRLLEADSWDFRTAIGFERRPDVAGNRLVAVCRLKATKRDEGDGGLGKSNDGRRSIRTALFYWIVLISEIVLHITAVTVVGYVVGRRYKVPNRGALTGLIAGLATSTLLIFPWVGEWFSMPMHSLLVTLLTIIATVVIVGRDERGEK